MTMGPRQIIGVSSSTMKPIDMTLTGRNSPAERSSGSGPALRLAPTARRAWAWRGRRYRHPSPRPQTERGRGPARCCRRSWTCPRRRLAGGHGDHVFHALDLLGAGIGEGGLSELPGSRKGLGRRRPRQPLSPAGLSAVRLTSARLTPGIASTHCCAASRTDAMACASV